MRLSLNLVIASTFGAVAPASANYDLDSLLEMPLCSLADALSLAPGLHVAKYSNFDWGVMMVRGNNETLNNKILVMVDGRSVFNPMSSGDDWDLIQVSMENTSQIEIVLGPVGMVWGGNVVTGIINVITKEVDGVAKCKMMLTIRSVILLSCLIKLRADVI
ncbi:hypothetical protein A9266_24425 [Vibrio tasmaniensis]|nr:hypothetical protein A9266_24425 [Vibrio tasmaniensis]